MKRINKIKLIGLGNDGYRYHYSVVKLENFKPVFIDFMVDLGFDGKKVDEFFYSQDQEGNEIPLKINSLQDDLFNWRNKSFDVDCFFRSRKISLIIRTNNHNKLIKVLEKHSEFKKISQKIKKSEGKK